MITYITEINDPANNTEIVGVSSNWSTAIKRLMEHYPGRTEYDEKQKMASDLWAIRIDSRVVGYVIKMELDKPLS